MSQPDTKERILDAAENLFAHEGLHSTSLRAITARAQVNLAAVNYHFGSKEALIQAVFERRLKPLNEARLERLEQVRHLADASDQRPEPNQALSAFIEPTLQFCGSCPGADDFAVLVGRALHEPDDTVRSLFVDLMRPVFSRLFDTLSKALPHLDRNTLFWRLQFSLGAMGHTLCWTRQLNAIPGLPEGVNPSPDPSELNKLLLTFLTAGMEAP